MIAITIDDGFSTSAVLADLAILESEHVNATWFPIGHVVASAPDTWREVAGAGFPIGNHTYDHTNLTRHSYAQVLADIEKDNAVVSKVIGERLVPFVRPMGGSWNTTVLAAAAAAKERAVVLWDATTGDTGRLPGRTDVDLLVRNATRGTDGSIILMHANLPYTQQALPRIIAYYRERGFEFVTLGQMFGVPGPVPFPPDVPTQRPATDHRSTLRVSRHPVHRVVVLETTGPVRANSCLPPTQSFGSTGNRLHDSRRYGGMLQQTEGLRTMSDSCTRTSLQRVEGRALRRHAAAALVTAS